MKLTSRQSFFRTRFLKSITENLKVGVDAPSINAQKYLPFDAYEHRNLGTMIFDIQFKAMSKFVDLSFRDTRTFLVTINLGHSFYQ